MNVKIILVCCVIVAGLIAFFISLEKPVPESAATYEEALIATESARVSWPQPESEIERAALARFKALWGDLNAESVHQRLPAVYADDVWFNDTVKTITNRSHLLAYMLHTASLVKSTRVEVRDIARTDEGYYVRWMMEVEPANPRYGTLWTSIGMSHIRFNQQGEVVLHQDYWDSASGLYEHFPLLGWMIRAIKVRL